MFSFRSIVLPALLFSHHTQSLAQNLPILKTTKSTIDIQIGKTLEKDAWSLSPETKPDIKEVPVAKGKTETVSFISDLGKITFKLAPGQSFDFNIVKGDVVCWTRVTGVLFTPAAVYDEAFKRSHRGKIDASVPEAYELVNIIIALTDTARTQFGLVRTNTDYFKEVQAYFADSKQDPVVLEFNKRMNLGSYFYYFLKMNGNSLEFSGKGELVKRREYNRTGFSGQTGNPLDDLLPQLNEFARKSRFREFYQSHKPFYQSQERFFLKEANLGSMRDWLQAQFPQVSPYDYVDVVFSPLVGYNQSSTNFESNGFRVLQPHVDFPYPSETANIKPALSPEGMTLRRGLIVFTEINHGYLSPTAFKHKDEILKATTLKDVWLSKQMQSSYQGTYIFDEYMNWGLFPLYAADRLPADADAIMQQTIASMTRRGFPQFKEFQPFLMNLYRSRKKGETVASLYPQIIKWFADHNK